MTNRVVDLGSWFDKHGPSLATHGARILLVLVMALLVRALLHRGVNRLVHTAVTGGVFRPLKERARGTVFDASPLLSERRRQRTETLGSVLRSVASFTVFVIAGTTILGEIGLNLTPIVASAGIIGVAVAFGAQNLVKDVLTGMAMLLEDQYGVGDLIDAGGVSGTVEAVTLRTTRLRDVDGTVWHLRNGEIVRVGNRSQGWARALVDLTLPLTTDLAAARATVTRIGEQLAKDPAFAAMVLEPPQVWGVQSSAPDALVLRVAQKTAPMQQGTVERELRERLLAALREQSLGQPST